MTLLLPLHSSNSFYLLMTSVFSLVVKNLKSLELQINKELDKISEWLAANKLTLNVSKSNFIIFRSKANKTKHSLEETLKNIYFSFIQSYLSYGIINCRIAVPTIFEPIRILMKKAVRFMTFSEKDTHSPPLFKELGILNLNDMIKLEWCKVIYDFHNNACITFVFTTIIYLHL